MKELHITFAKLRRQLCRQSWLYTSLRDGGWPINLVMRKLISLFDDDKLPVGDSSSLFFYSRGINPLTLTL